MTIGELLLGLLIVAAFVTGTVLTAMQGRLLEWLAAMAMLFVLSIIHTLGKAR